MPRYSKPFSVLEVGIFEAVRGAAGAAQSVIDGVAAVMYVALKDSAKDGHALRDAVPLIAAAAVRGGAKARGDLCYVARGFMSGLLRASGWKGARSRDLIAVGSSSFLLNAREAGADEVEVSRCLVEGSIVWAAELEQDESAAASVAARSVVAAAAVLDARAGRRVHDALKDGVAGVSVVFKETAPANS
jgi:hypothetical protein